MAPEWKDTGDPDAWPERWINEALALREGRAPGHQAHRPTSARTKRAARRIAGASNSPPDTTTARGRASASSSPRAGYRLAALLKAVWPGRGRGRPRPSCALSTRSRSSRLAESPTHRGHLWTRRRPFDRLRAGAREGARDGARRRPDPCGPHCARTDPHRRGAGDRETNRRSAGSGARARHHSSRFEAGQHQSARGRHRESAGLRAGEAQKRERVGMDGRIRPNPQP